MIPEMLGNLEIRPVVADEAPRFARAAALAFGLSPADDELDNAAAVAELDRTLAVFDQERIVATVAGLTMQLTVPGPRTVPAAGLTFAGVMPTHRRRGLLSELTRRTLEDARRRDEPVSVLTASEATIYGRYGYGVATTGLAVEIERAHAALAGPSDAGDERLRILGDEEAALVIPGVFDRIRRSQPGEVDRPQWWWELWKSDPEHRRQGAGPRLTVVYEHGGEVDGYAAYRVRGEWSEGGLPGHELRVEEIVAADADAEAALWRYLLSVDLVKNVKVANLAEDTPLRWLLADCRRMEVWALHDLLWVRLVDVPAALEARAYGASGSVVLDVTDPFLPEAGGRWRLDAGPDGCECRSTSTLADLALDVADLAATYLGGVRFATLVRAGRVHEVVPGAAARADALFTAVRPPWTTTDF